MVSFEDLKKQKQTQQSQSEKQPQQQSSQNAQQQKQSEKQPQNEKQNGKRPILYPNTGSIALILAQPKKGKYGYLVFAKPIYGTYYNGKEKKSVGIRDLQSDTVYLKIKDEELANVLQKGMVLVWNPQKSKKIITYSGENHG